MYSLNFRNAWKETIQYALCTASVYRTFLKFLLAKVNGTVSTQLSLSCHVRNYVSLAHLCLIYEVKEREGEGYLVQPRVVFFSSYALFSKYEGRCLICHAKDSCRAPLQLSVGVGCGGFARPSSGGAKESHEKHDPAENKTRHLSNTSFEH
jgi:hypothetical protein